MVVIKPKSSTYFSLGIIVVAFLAGLILILRDFAYKGSFGFWFYLIAATIITLVLLMLLVKMLAGFRFITAGRDQIIIKMPLRGFHKAYPVSDILAWEEEVVMANKKEFKQLTIAFSDKQSISVSNHEHDAYTDLIKYLIKKAPRQRVKSKKA